MVAPLRLKGSETTGPNSQNPNINAGVSVYAIQEMSESEVLDGISYKLLREFAKVDLLSPKTGDLTLRDTVGDTPTISTGDYVDTTRNLDVGGKGSFNELNQIRSNATSIYQVLTPVTGQIVRPLCYENLELREMSDDEIVESILTPTMNRMTNRGIGSYHFSTEAPKDPDSGADLPGTWSVVFTLNDNYKTGTVPSTSVVGFAAGNSTSTITYNVAQQSTNVIVPYRLWRKIDDSAPPQTQPRPLKFANTAERGKHVVEMTNAEILTLLVQFRNLIVTDGRGRYKFQDGAPVGGSWSRRGEAIQDLLNAVTDSYFQSGTRQTSTNFFTRVVTSTSTVTRSFTGTYTGPVTRRDFSGSFSRSFTGTYNGGFVRSSTGQVPITKFFARVDIATFNSGLIDSIVTVQNNDFLWIKRAN